MVAATGPSSRAFLKADGLFDSIYLKSERTNELVLFNWFWIVLVSLQRPCLPVYGYNLDSKMAFSLAYFQVYENPPPRHPKLV